MADNWSTIKKEVSTYRDYVKNLPADAAAEAKFCYLLSKDEINRLLGQKGDGTTLDGIRIYLGANEIEGKLVPTIHAVAVEKSGAAFNDYNVPKAMPEAGHAPSLFGAAPGTGSTGNLPPCPSICSDNNILNS